MMSNIKALIQTEGELETSNLYLPPFELIFIITWSIYYLKFIWLKQSVSWKNALKGSLTPQHVFNNFSFET